MKNRNHNTTRKRVLSTIKTMWVTIYEMTERNEGLARVERQFEALVAGYRKATTDMNVSRLIDLLQALDSAGREEINCRATIADITSQVLGLLKDLGAEEIMVQCGARCDPREYCVVGRYYRPELAADTILEVVRRGFQAGTYRYPAEVIVSTAQKPGTEPAPAVNLGTVGAQQILYAFDGGTVTTDTGVLLVQGVDAAIGVVDKLAGAISDRRDARYVTHSVRELLAQRIYQIALGYEDANDSNFLRQDPAFKTALARGAEDARDLASQPTMSRFENAVGAKDLIRMAYKLGELFIQSYQQEPDIIILDFDTTDDPTHGNQENTVFNAYYDEHCYLPLHIYEGLSGRLIATILRPGKTPSGREIVTILRLIVNFLRRHWPNTLLLFRADSQFAAPEVFTYLEQQNIFYVIGSSAGSYAPLNALAADIRGEVQRIYQQRQVPVKRYATFYYQAGSWESPRRIVAKAEFSEQGANTRFVITNLETRAKKLYEDIYCARGNCENCIKDHKTYLKSDRTSCSAFVANQLRLLLHSAAYVLLYTLRSQYLKGSAFATATFNTIQLRILKVGAIVKSSKTRIRFSLPTAYPLQDLWHNIIATLFPTHHVPPV